MTKFLTRHEAAELLGIHMTTLRNYIRDGLIPQTPITQAEPDAAPHVGKERLMLREEDVLAFRDGGMHKIAVLRARKRLAKLEAQS